ncbi:MAG TPA: class Ib ribonucleoside-diphosphate reductase assembly flavoprotein NrdI [Acholeplasma sp.]|nr:class Ib ribonucleoside-diphosphate reductase assembly flavoprotein NrdI [Acholeplasma sp.]
MIIVYDSLTNQTKRFAEKIGLKVIDINAYDVIENDEKILLITRSYNFGEIPLTTISFLQKHANKVCGVAVSGNRNWGKNYGAAGDKIQAQYGIPLILKFEGSGMSHEVDILKKWVKSYQ